MIKTRIITSKYYDELENELNRFLVTVKELIDIKIITNRDGMRDDVVALITYKE